MLKVFSTFTGIGSPEMALRNVGVEFESVGISEVDKSAVIIYDVIHSKNPRTYFHATKEQMLEEIKNKNIAYNFSTGECEIPKTTQEMIQLYQAHKNSKNFGDIRLIDEKTLPDFDLFTYSFPCKNISIAGRQEGLSKKSNTQSSLLWECERIIKHKKPTYLLMENVKNLVSRNHIDDFKTWINILDSFGYNSYWNVLNAKDYGLPQNRERVMMISILKNKDKGFHMPRGSKDRHTVLNKILEKNVPSSLIMEPSRYEHFDKSVQYQESLGKIIKVGYLQKKNHANKRVYSPAGIAPTLNSMNGGNRQPKIYQHAMVRKLTPLECWRCMGYTDDDFNKAKLTGLSNSRLYERAGRGIAVPMLEAIFMSLFLTHGTP